MRWPHSDSRGPRPCPQREALAPQRSEAAVGATDGRRSRPRTLGRCRGQRELLGRAVGLGGAGSRAARCAALRNPRPRDHQRSRACSEQPGSSKPQQPCSASTLLVGPSRARGWLLQLELLLVSFWFSLYVVAICHCSGE